MTWDDIFIYRDGLLYWKERPVNDFATVSASKVWNAQFPGRVAGTPRRSSKTLKYVFTAWHGKKIGVHRVVWEMHNGKIKEGLQIDHIDGNGENNRIENLRLVTRQDNSKNRKLNANNVLGVAGVYVVRSSGLYCAHIRSGGIGINLGHYKTIFDAVCARRSAEELHGFHVNHGKRQ